MHMFEVLRDVEGCPATVLSAQRSFVRRLDVTDIGNPGKTGGKGEALSIFLFSDSIEVSACVEYVLILFSYCFCCRLPSDVQPPTLLFETPPTRPSSM